MTQARGSEATNARRSAVAIIHLAPVWRAGNRPSATQRSSVRTETPRARAASVREIIRGSIAAGAGAALSVFASSVAIMPGA